MISEFVATYGYLSIFFGTLLEGETILIAGGFAAHRGMLNLPLVILVAIVGSSLGDQLAFWLGRYKGNALMERVPALARRKDRIHELLHRYDALIPHVDGSARICELVRYFLEDVTVKGAWSGPAALELAQHALAPVPRLPVLAVLSGTHNRCRPHARTRRRDSRLLGLKRQPISTELKEFQ